MAGSWENLIYKHLRPKISDGQIFPVMWSKDWCIEFSPVSSTLPISWKSKSCRHCRENLLEAMQVALFPCCLSQYTLIPLLDAAGLGDASPLMLHFSHCHWFACKLLLNLFALANSSPQPFFQIFSRSLLYCSILRMLACDHGLVFVSK